MSKADIIAYEASFSKGEAAGMQEAQLGYGKRDCSKMVDPIYAEGYSVGYDMVALEGIC